MSDTRYSWEIALSVASAIYERLRPYCTRAEIAGSLRRRKPDVGDIEILYVPVIVQAPDPDDLFRINGIDRAALAIGEMIGAGILEKRRNALSREMFGPKNKLMRHVSTGIPIDLFASTEENWFNYLVCRTGPSESNMRICNAAIAKGWKWNPYGVGFSTADGEVRRMESERAVFDFVGLPYHEPGRRI
jgi:DNA polymerase/3'-5' exonuclease PolX